jgi:hypothetical protein
MATHALATTGTGSTSAATKTKLGSTLTLPAGGPWIIHHVWGMVAKVTTIPDQGTGGQLIVDALTGDLTPDPAPGKFPLIGNCLSSSANAGICANPLNLWPVRWEASGKAQIDLSYLQQLASTTANAAAAGIIFGDSIPEVRPLVFCDGVYSAFASASESTIGTITLAEKATRIVGICADLNHGEAATAGEANLATIRLDSADVKMPPAQYPCNRCFDASDGTAVGVSATPQTQFIPVDIPVTGGARINCFATSTASVTGNCEVQVFIAYE